MRPLDALLIAALVIGSAIAFVLFAQSGAFSTWR